MTPLRLLVTGGTGLAGAALVAAARRDGGFDVHATWHRAPPAAARAGAATWHPLDVRDRAATIALLSAVRPAVVVHAALDTTPGSPAEVGVPGAAHVAGAARAVSAFHVHLSSDMVFDGESGPYDEDAVPRPISDYGRAKAEAERRVRAAHPDAIVVRLPLLYRLDPPDGALAAWIAATREGRGYPLFVDEIRCPAQVDDAAEALRLVARALADGTPLVPPIVHLPGPRAISRYDFGVGALAALGLPAGLAVRGRVAEATSPRPRQLVFVARRTPAAFVAPLRAPELVFSATTRATPPAGR
jgi:dTDP-4-dehydrorhamnose reductase